MKTKLFLFVLLFSFVISCSKDDKEDRLTSDEVDIEFEAVSNGKVTNVGGYIYIQEDLNKGSYYDLSGQLIGTINNNQNTAVTEEILKEHMLDVSFELPIKIKKKAKRGVQVILLAWNPYEIETVGSTINRGITKKIYVNGVVVPNLNVIDNMYEEMIANYIKLGFTREEAENIIEASRGEQSNLYVIAVPLK